MMGSGSPFEGMPGGIGERNGMIRLPYHPLTSLIRHFDNGQALALLHSGRGGRYSVLGLHAYHRLMQYGDDVMEGTLVVCGDDDVWAGSAIIATRTAPGTSPPYDPSASPPPLAGAVAKRLRMVIQTPRTPQPPTAAHGAATTIAPHTARPWNDSNRTCTTAKPT